MITTPSPNKRKGVRTVIEHAERRFIMAVYGRGIPKKSTMLGRIAQVDLRVLQLVWYLAQRIVSDSLRGHN
jgi:hypothetical protein